MARLAPREGFELLKDRVKEAVAASFPQEGKQHVLDIKSVDIKDDLDIEDIGSQKTAKLNGRTWGVPVHATMVLKDKESGKVLDQKKVKVATLPKYTRRHSFIVDGSEYQVDNQWRLKPGVYTRIKQNGELESRFNFQGKQNLDMTFDPKTRQFRMVHGGSKPPLYPILKAAGIDDDSLERAWGKDILKANQSTPAGKALDVHRLAMNFAKRLDPDAKVESFDDAGDVIRKYMDSAELRPDVTKITLGKEYKNITPDAMLRTSGRLLGVARGEQKPDTRDALQFKDLLSVEDFVAERITRNSRTIGRRIGNNVDRRQSIREIVGPDIFNRPIKEFFSKTSLASTPEQVNPLEMISGQQKTTITGEGGVKSAHKIVEDAKLVDPSHFGVLDPLHTPEGEKTGVALHLATTAVKDGQSVKVPLFNVRTQKMEMLGPAEVDKAVIAMPDQGKFVKGKWRPNSGKVRASAQGNEIKSVSSRNVQYVMRQPTQMFGVATNMVPFLSSDSPNRSTMAGRHMEQAIPLKYREAPLVQADRGDGKTFDEFMGRYASHEAPVAGKVTKITPDYMTIKGADGKSRRVHLYNDYPLNDKKGVMHSTPTVKVGQKVKKGELVADTNYTKDGVYAPGTNLKVAYMPWKGYNFEDGVVISESAAKKLTSEHMHKKSISTRDASLIGKNKYRANFATAMTPEQADKLDDDGVVQVGQEIKPGDTLIAAATKAEVTTEQQMLRKLHRSLPKPYSDRAVRWNEEVPGKVVGVTKRGKKVQVHVRTDEGMEVGDKLVGRHGNKGIVTKILPDGEMPQQENGTPLDVVMNPIGIPGRMNVGQVLETAAGKVARKRGEPFKVRNFSSTDNRSAVEQELKAEGIKDKETVTDPVSGKAVPDVLVGDQYILKLQHQVGKKLTARSRDAYDRNLVPRGGGPHGAQALGSLGVYAMLAHGAKANLREMQTYKCFLPDTRVYTDQGPMRIGHIVNQELQVEVLSYNTAKREFEYRKIKNYWKREIDSTPLVEVTVYAPDSRGVFRKHRTRCTHEHEIYTSDGRKVFARDLKGEHVLAPAAGPSKGQFDVLVGSLLGDGSLQVHNGVFPVFQERHSIRQREYLEFKAALLEEFSEADVRDYDAGHEGFNNGQKMCEWRTLAQPAFSDLHASFYVNSVKRVPGNIEELLNPLSVAVWYQDDGSLVHGNRQRVLRLHTESFGAEDLVRLRDAVNAAVGVNFTITNGHQLRLGVSEEIDRFIEYVSPFVHESMAYKVDGAVCGWALDDLQHSDIRLLPVPVVSVRPYRNPKIREGRYLYNLEVEGNHNYFANGVLVGNSDKNDDLWAALQAGEPIPPPRPTFAYQKFMSYMKGMGVNAEKDGNSLNLVPITDKQVLEMSNGKLKDAGRAVKMKTLTPESGGLFDPKVTGGMDGVHWSHIELKERMPNPLFEKAIMSLTGIRGPQFERLIRGTEGVDKDGAIVGEGVDGATYGPQALAKLLGNVDVNKDLKAAEEQLPKLKDQQLNETRRKVKYLRALKKLDMDPVDAYTMKNVPVLPPRMRPLSAMEDGRIQFDDLNELYKRTWLLDDQLRKRPKFAPEDSKTDLRADLYDHMKALTGIGGSLKGRYSGIGDIISGTSPKLGYVQDKLVKRKQDMTMRSTIVPEPALSLDEVGIPRKAAMEVYKPFVVREVRKVTGGGVLAAKKAVEQNDPVAQKALEKVVEDRPLLVKRDPALHKYNIQAFKPKLTEGRAIQVHPLVCSGYNADFDGDTMSAFVPMTQEAVEEARKMHPSNILFNPATAQVMYTPTHEAQVGLYMMADVGKKTAKRFKTKADLSAAVKAGKIAANDVATVGTTKTTLNRMILNDALPKGMQGGKLLTDLNYRFTKGEQNKLFGAMAKADRNGYAKRIDKMKDMGNTAATLGGFSFGLDEFKVHKDIRDPILADAAAKTARLNLNKKEDVEKFVDTYESAMRRMDSKLKTKVMSPKTKDALGKLEVAAGIKGKGYRQLTAAPVLFVDAKGEVVTSPVDRSFSEGLDAASYWAATSGGRKGVVQKVQSVAQPGYLTKLMMNTTMNTMVNEDDCGTDRGISLSVDEPDAIGRFLTAPVKAGRSTIKAGTLVTPEVLDKVKNAKVSRIVARSPMRCNHEKGVCAKCMGINEDGQLPDKGTNVGVMAAQALGERGTQLALKAFHSGGVYEGKEREGSIQAKGLDRALTLLHMPQKVSGSAVLSTSSGKVSSVKRDPAGGHNVKVEGETHYVPSNRKLLPGVKVGAKVKKGAPLTGGPINPHEMLPLTGMNKVQGYLASELHKLYGKEGIRRRQSEVVVRSLSDVTKVEDPGDHSTLIRGDFASTSDVNAWNRRQKAKGRKPVMHNPVLRGVRQTPLDVSTDWLARLNHENLRGTLVEAAQQGWRATLHGEHPIPPLIYGAEFGKGTPKKPWTY